MSDLDALLRGGAGTASQATSSRPLTLHALLKASSEISGSSSRAVWDTEWRPLVAVASGRDHDEQTTKGVDLWIYRRGRSYSVCAGSFVWDRSVGIMGGVSLNLSPLVEGTDRPRAIREFERAVLDLQAFGCDRMSSLVERELNPQKRRLIAYPERETTQAALGRAELTEEHAALCVWRRDEICPDCGEATWFETRAHLALDRLRCSECGYSETL